MILLHNEIVKSLAAQSVIVSTFSTSRDSNVVCLGCQHCRLLSLLLIDSTRLGTELRRRDAPPGLFRAQCPPVAAVITVYASVMTVMCLLGNYPHGWANSNKHWRHRRQYSHISTRLHTTRWARGAIWWQSQLTTFCDNVVLSWHFAWHRDTSYQPSWHVITTLGLYGWKFPIIQDDFMGLF